MEQSEADASRKSACRPVPTHSPQISRRRVLHGLGAALAIPSFPVAFAEATLPAASGALESALVQPPPSMPQPVPTAVQTVATATISTPVGTLPDYFLGLSYEKGAFATESLFTAANTSLAGLFNRLGNGVLRIGGNSVDTTLWTSNGSGNTSGQVAPADVDNLSAFLALTNWKLLYGLNLGTSTPALAGAEADYVQSKLGNLLVGFEIGNEPDEYGLSYFPGGWSLTAYETLWEQFRTAILAAAPSAIITGPASGGNVITWTVPFVLGPEGKFVSLVTQHYYRGNGHSARATAANLVSPDTAIVADCVALKSALSALNVPFRLSETNSYLYGGSPGVSNAYASALWVIDHLFKIALGGGSGVNMQGGDIGSYTPVANSGSAILEVRPEYYGLLLFSLAGQGTLLRSTLSTSNFNATIYAVLTPAGGTNIVIVNKEVYQSLRLTIHCGKTVNNADLIELRGTALTATTGQTLEGGAVATDGSITPGTPYAPLNVSSSWVTCYVPAISAVLLRLS